MKMPPEKVFVAWCRACDAVRCAALEDEARMLIGRCEQCGADEKHTRAVRYAVDQEPPPRRARAR